MYTHTHTAASQRLQSLIGEVRWQSAITEDSQWWGAIEEKTPIVAVRHQRAHVFRDKPPTLGSPGLGRKGGLGIHKEEEESGLGGGGRKSDIWRRRHSLFCRQKFHTLGWGGGGRERIGLKLTYIICYSVTDFPKENWPTYTRFCSCLDFTTITYCVVHYIAEEQWQTVLLLSLSCCKLCWIFHHHSASHIAFHPD